MSQKNIKELSLSGLVEQSNDPRLSIIDRTAATMELIRRAKEVQKKAPKEGD